MNKTQIAGFPRASFIRQVGLRKAVGTTIGWKRVSFAVVIRFDRLGRVHWKGLDVTYASDGARRTQRIAPSLTLYSRLKGHLHDCPSSTQY